MSGWISRLFAAPVFENQEKTRVARILNYFSWGAIGILLVIILIRQVFWTGGLSPIFVLSTVVLILVVVQILIRRGYVRGASLFLVYAAWATITYQAWDAEGIRDAAISGYLLIVLLASLLLGWRESFFIGLLSLLAIWYFAFLEYRGVHSFHLDAPLNYARDLTVLFILSGTLIYLLLNNLNLSLNNAQLELSERLRAEEKLQQQADYLSVLHETALRLLNRSELKPLLESILEQACNLINTENGLIELILPDGSALRQEIGRGYIAKYNGELTKRNEGVNGTAWASGETIIIQDYPSWEKRLPEFVTAGVNAVMAIPLIVENNVIGVLSVSYFEKKRTFSQQQIDLMERFAALAALAIHNIRLNESLQSKLHEKRLIETALRASEERFRKVFHASPVAICITTLEDGILLDGNNAYWSMSGYDPEISKGKNYLELEMWESKEAREEFVTKLKQDRSIYNPNYEFNTPKYEPRSAVAFYELIDLNERTCVLSMFHDITAQKQAELALRDSEARISAILSAIPDMIFEVKEDGTLTGFIPSDEIRLAMPLEDFLGKKIKDVFPESISAQAMFALERAIASNQLHAFEYGLPSGEEAQFYEARVAPLSSDSAIMMVRDISQRKWVETERETLINELEEKNAELERFTYTVSHDLKSPLITIKGFLGFLEQDAASGNITRLKKDIQRISDATVKMQALLNELLELSRVGRLMNPYEHVPFDEIALEAVELVQGRIISANAKVNIQENLPTVYGDKKRLIEVVQNLVDNAAKFFGNQTSPQIEIGQDGTNEGKPVFFVRDNGIGIQPEHQDSIFGLFNKLDSTTDGTGIGLALVKRIVEVHHGRIWVQSEAGKGATFFFTLQTKPESDS